MYVDLPKCMDSTELRDRLRLHDIKDRRWHLQPSCPILGTGLAEVMKFLFHSCVCVILLSFSLFIFFLV